MKTDPLRTFEEDVVTWHEVLRTYHIAPSHFDITQRGFDIFADLLSPSFKLFEIRICDLPCYVVPFKELH